MKHLKTIILVLLAMFFFDTSACAQVETRATLTFTINGGRWNKVIKNGDPITIFSYKLDGDTHSFGIYSDDYAGEINMKGIPFDVNTKELKKLPKKSKKNLKTYTEVACTKAREKALSGKYRTIARDGIMCRDYTLSYVSKNEPITIIGYKKTRGYVDLEYLYSIVKDDCAGIYYNSEFDIVTPIDNVPLPFLPSTDDPHVRAVIANAMQTIKKRKDARERAYYEKQRKLEEERIAHQKALEEQEFEDLKLMDPAYIEIKKIKMDNAGGNEVTIKFTNCSSLKIKYVYFTGYFLNAVGDKCRDEITGSTVWKYTGVGPVSRIPNAPDRFGSYIKYFHSDPLFYSKNARKFRLSSVTIEYMNGKKKVLSGAELDDRVDYTDY